LLFGITLSACSDVATIAGNPGEDADPTAEQNAEQEAERGTEPALPTSDTGVEGYLWIGPACPVVKLGTECPDLPYEAEFTITDAEGEFVASGMSDESGFFRILLAPGSYVFVPDASKPAISPRANPVPFDVDAGAFTQLEVTYDSGLR
jgi:hypothetical protein